VKSNAGRKRAAPRRRWNGGAEDTNLAKKKFSRRVIMHRLAAEMADEWPTSSVSEEATAKSHTCLRRRREGKMRAS